MKKGLDNMSTDELGKLFPIIISEYNPNWITLFRREESRITKILGKDKIIRIEHIGSTSVPNLISKPTVDILIEVPVGSNKDLIVKKLTKLGYYYIPKPENPAPHMMFVKGYTMKGFKGQVYHIHVRHSGDWDELYFRDYIKAHPAIAKEYGKLKVKLSKDYRYDRDGYTDKKSDFINRITMIARKEKIVTIKKVSLNGE